MDKMKYKTIADFLNCMANSYVNDETDEKYMNYILKYIFDLPSITVTCGIVYGLAKEPVDIHTVSKVLLKTLVDKNLVDKNAI